MRSAIHALLFAAIGCASAPPVAVTPQAAPAPPPVAPALAAPAPATQAPTTDYSGLGAASVSPELVARHAAQPLDPAVSRRIQRYLDIRGAGGGMLTDKGDRMVFTWNVTGTPQVWRLDGPMKHPVQLTGGEDPTTVAGLTPDGKFVLVSRDVGGEENPGLYLLSIEGGPLSVVQHAPGVQTHLAFVSDDGRYVYYTANDLQPDSYALHRFDRQTSQRETVFSEPGLWFVADHRGDELLLGRALGNTHIEYHRYEQAAKRLTPLLGQGEAVEYSAAFGARPGTLIVKHDKQGDFHRLYEWKDGTFTPISPGVRHEVSDFAIDDARRRITYVMNENGYERLHVLDARTYKEQPLPRLPAAENVYGGKTTRNGRFMTLGVDGATLIPTNVIYDWQTKKLTQWRAASTPEVDVSKFTVPSLESYPARDGTPIPMFVWRPAGCAEPCPVVVNFHGGPEGQSTAGFSVWAQIFVDAGFVFVQPNVRGSSGYGKTWLDADNASRRLEVITDIEDAALHIKKTWAKDGRSPKVGVLGGSYGGYATLMAMTYFAGAYDAGVSEVGIANLLTFLQNTAPYRRILRVSEYGDPEKDHEALVKLSPVTYADRVKAPLLIIQGVNDPRVPVGEALVIHDNLAARQIPTQLILFADEGHGTAKRGNKVLSIGHTLAFFEKHLR